MTPTPPHRWSALLRRALRGHAAREAILGDLHEDFVERHERLGRAAARRWYARQTIALAIDLRLHSTLLSGTATVSEFLTPRALLQDVGYAFRSLRRAPGFVVLTASIIGLGIGATAAVFSVLKPLALAPLPVGNPDELVWVALNDGDREDLSMVTSRTGNLRDFRELASSFDGLTGFNAFSGQGAYTLEVDGRVEQLAGYGVAHDFLRVLQVEPGLGRDFTDDEATWDGDRPIILTHGFWQQRFGSDPSVVGRTVTLNDRATEIAGVLPASFDFASVFVPARDVDFLTVFEISDMTNNWGNMLHMVGRLRPGVTPEAAQAELESIIAGLEAEQPDRWGLGAHVTPLNEMIAAPFRGALTLLAAAAAAVLLIVIVNASNMLLARAPGRVREVAVRKALGASRGRLIRQMLAESTLIALAGSTLGAAIAFGATRVVSSTAGIRVPLLDQVRVDGTVLAFSVAVAVLTGLVVGLVPALQVSEGEEATALRSGSRNASATRGARRLRESLVIAEIALASILLVAGGLLIRSFAEVTTVDLGFEPEGTVAWQLNPTGSYDTNEEWVAYFNTISNRVEQIPGVESVGMIDGLPLGRNRSWGLRIVGRETEDPMGFFTHVGDPGYFETMGIGLVAGRHLAEWDTPDAPQSIVVNESGAERYFGSAEAALGQQLDSWSGIWEIVGVVEDVLHVSPEAAAGTQVYFPMAQQSDWPSIEMIVRTRRPTPETAAAVIAAAAEIDPGMPMQEFFTMEERVARSVSARRFLLQILIAFGVSALILAGLGIYGVLAYGIAERRSEIGIRMALGATSGSVVGSVFSRTMTLTGVGIVLGIAGSLLATRLLQSLLYGVAPGDPLTFTAMIATLVTVAALAGSLPAVRAARMSGVRALRSE